MRKRCGWKRYMAMFLLGTMLFGSVGCAGEVEPEERMEEPEKVVGGLKIILQLFDNAKGILLKFLYNPSSQCRSHTFNGTGSKITLHRLTILRLHSLIG